MNRNNVKKIKHRFALLSIAIICVLSVVTRSDPKVNGSTSTTIALSSSSTPDATITATNHLNHTKLELNNKEPNFNRSASLMQIAANKPSPPPPLETIEDVEMLSFFVMWNYYGRFRPLEQNENEDNSQLSNDNASESEMNNNELTAYDKSNNQSLHFSEFALHQFLDDLRNGKLDQRKKRTVNQMMNLDCNDLNADFYQQLRNEYPGDIYTKRMQILCKAATQCHSTESMLSLIRDHPLKRYPSTSTSSTTPAPTEEIRFSQSIVRLCPLILFQLQDQNCTAKREQDLNMHLPKPSHGSVWGFSFLFVTIISFCSLIGVTILPFTSRSSYQNALNLFEGLAVGSLIGSALFHLIPQSFNLMSLQDDYLWKALTIFAGIYLFFWSELLMKTITEMRRRTKIRIRNEKSTTDCNAAEDLPTKKVIFAHNGQSNFINQSHNNHTEEGHPISDGPLQLSLENLPVSSSPTCEYHLHHHNYSHHNHHNNNRQDDSPLSRWTETSPPPGSHPESGSGQIATVAWMIVFGDGLHNFVDGLSIGAAFSESIMSGISVSVAVVCEEFPHELGDFAVLLASGMTLRQAIGYNFLSACSCYVGMALGIMIGDISHTSSYILALAGGMFLYIALVDMMSELSSAVQYALQQSKTLTCKVIALQHFGILIGIGSLFLLAKYSEQIKFEGFAPPRILAELHH